MPNVEFQNKEYNLEKNDSPQEQNRQEIRKQIDQYPFAEAKTEQAQIQQATHALVEALDQTEVNLQHLQGNALDSLLAKFDTIPKMRQFLLACYNSQTQKLPLDKKFGIRL